MNPIFRRTYKTLSLCLLVAYFVTAPFAARSDEGHDHHEHESAQSDDPTEEGKKKESKYLFGNHVCPVTGEGVDPDSFVEVRNEDMTKVGRIYLCCNACDKKVEKKFDKLYETYYRTDEKTGKKIDPVDLDNPSCPMSGNDVEEDIVLEYNGMILRFCCTGCRKDFLDVADEKLEKIVKNLKDFRYKRPAGSGSSKE